MSRCGSALFIIGGGVGYIYKGLTRHKSRPPPTSSDVSYLVIIGDEIMKDEMTWKPNDWVSTLPANIRRCPRITAAINDVGNSHHRQQISMNLPCGRRRRRRLSPTFFAPFISFILYLCLVNATRIFVFPFWAPRFGSQAHSWVHLVMVVFLLTSSKVSRSTSSGRA